MTDLQFDLYTNRAQWQESLRSAWPGIIIKEPVHETIRLPDIVKVDDPEKHIILVDTALIGRYDFPEALRDTLRGDPEVIFVGELRDEPPFPHVAFTTIETLLTNLHLFMAVTLLLTEENLASLPPFASTTTFLRLALRDAREYLNPLLPGDPRGSATDRRAVRDQYRQRNTLVASDPWCLQTLTTLNAALDAYDTIDGRQRGYLERQLTQAIDNLLKKLDVHVDKAVTPNHEAKQQLLDELEAAASPYTRP